MRFVSLGAQLIDKDGSEGITEVKIHLEGADAGAAFTDINGGTLSTTLQVELPDGSTATAQVDISGGCLTLPFDGSATAGHDIALSEIIGVKLPIDDSDDFTVHVAATTPAVTPDGDAACEAKTSSAEERRVGKGCGSTRRSRWT